MQKSISQKALKKSSKIPAVIILSVLLIGGFAGIYFWTVKSYMTFRDSKNWIETPCVIISSKVGVHRGDDSTTFSVDITFEYEFEGSKYTSSRYNLAPAGSSTGYESKKEVVKKYPPGMETICFVNPKNPSQAVLNRDFTPAMLLTLIPFIPSLIGAGGLTIIRSSKKSQPKTIYDMDSSFDKIPTATNSAIPYPDTRGRIMLKPKEGRMGRIFWILMFSVIWDGILFILLFNFIKEKSFSLFLLAFFIPFIVIAIMMLVVLVVMIISLTNPKVNITVGSSAVPLGGILEIKWEIPERASSLQRLIINLEGIEEVTYSSGKHTRTDKNVFLQIPVIETTEHGTMIRGNKDIKIPENTMHSFKVDHNKILWMLKVVGEFPRWFRMKENYEIIILPFQG